MRYGDTDKSPGDGYRWLTEADVVQLGDEICPNGITDSYAIHIVTWATNEKVLNHPWHPEKRWPTRRKIVEFIDGF